MSDTSIRAIAISLLFIFSGVGASVLLNPAAAAASPNTAAPSAAAPVAAATPLTQAQANWEYPNGNQFDQDFNPQNQINSSNVQNLGLSWIYPLPVVPTALSSLSGIRGTSGVGMSVLVANGTAFATTVFDETIAFNVANGNVLWTFLSPLKVNQTAGEATGPVPLHSHDGNEWFTTATFGSGVSGPTLWYQGENNLVYAINAINGKQELNFTDFNGLNMVAGNNPQSVYNGIGASNIVIDQQRGILVAGHDAEIDADNGRGFFSGWNLNVNPPTMMWVTYDVPPQPGSSSAALNPYYDQQLIGNMSAAATFYPGANGSTNGYTTSTEIHGGVLDNVNNDIVVNWKGMTATQLNNTLYNDWGQSDQTAQCLGIDGGGSTGSTGSSWGGAWLVGSGQSSGMVFVGTNNKDPFVGPCNPGPDLWSAAVLGLNITTGKIIWGFQTTTHDVWDYDCSWWQALGNETINGVNTEVVFKTCKDGYLFEINAVTGNLVWAWDPPVGTETAGPSRCPVCFPMNPLNASQTGIDYPSALTNCAPTYTVTCERGPQPPFIIWPSATAGFEDEQAFNPVTNMLYPVSHLTPAYEGYVGLNSSTYFTSTGEAGVPCPNCETGSLYDNATVWGIYANNGTVKWDSPVSKASGYRGQVEESGNVVFVGANSEGDVKMYDATTGQLLRDYYIGAPMDVGVTIAAAVSGQEYLLMPVGTCGAGAISTCPGDTPGDIVALTLTPGTVSTSTTTIVSTSISVSTAAVSTATSVSTSITTVTASGSSSSGVSSTVLYGVAAVAVVFIIISGYLAMTRSRKPAS